MSKLSAGLLAIDNFDDLCRIDSPIHRVDARVKLLVTLAYLITVVSWPRYAVVEVLPLAAYPLMLGIAGRVPAVCIFKKVALAAPFVLMVGIVNPFIDTEPRALVSGYEVAGGWISLLSIGIRFVLTVSTTLILIGVTGMTQLCAAAQKLGAPKIFVTQLVLLYRYLFVLAESAIRMMRAVELRAPDKKRPTFAQFTSMVGHLLLRTIDRAQRIHVAMCCRGFTGCYPCASSHQPGVADGMFLIGWMMFFGLIRFGHIPFAAGEFALGSFR